ncbi:MAG: hypothetical protein V2I97_22820, partial [Desulfococcaceae bacterium]|nr:hypothetical protein [Desulfococcaceae bacterium]
MKKLFILTVMVMALFFSANAAYAVTLIFEDNGNGTVDIMADDSSQVLGAAFTVEYNSDILALTDVDSTYFGTFVQQFPELVNAADKKGMDASGNVDGFPAPIVENNLTGKVKIAAACHTANAANKKLFTLTFALKSGATSAPSTIRIVPTEMESTVGGYAVGDKIDPLIGVSGETYPVLLTKETLASNPVELPNYEIQTVEITVNLAAGLNIFTYPVEVPANYTSHDLLALLGGAGSVKKIIKYDGS